MSADFFVCRLLAGGSFLTMVWFLVFRICTGSLASVDQSGHDFTITWAPGPQARLHRMQSSIYPGLTAKQYC